MMKRSMIHTVLFGLAATLFLASPSFAQKTLNGAGATFPYPVYSQWAYSYNAITKVKINYNSIGSGGGIAQIKAKTVDFGASDAPLTKQELDADGLVQFPLIMGGVVPVVNISGIKDGELKMTGALLANIYLGVVTNWNDPAIKALNPSLTLPNRAITVVGRADGSGTTWIFTSYLDRISPNWHSKVGAGKAVSWPVGVGGKGNEGVAAYVQRIPGSIGYVEYAYAYQNKLTTAQLQNKSGAFVKPSIESFQAAAANANWTAVPGFAVELVDQPGATSWPIAGASFILIHRAQKDAELASTMLAYFDWCFKNGGAIAKQLHYVPVPENVVKLVQETWKTSVTASGKPVWK